MPTPDQFCSSCGRQLNATEEEFVLLFSHRFNGWLCDECWFLCDVMLTRLGIAPPDNPDY